MLPYFFYSAIIHVFGEVVLVDVVLHLLTLNLPLLSIIKHARLTMPSHPLKKLMAIPCPRQKKFLYGTNIVQKLREGPNNNAADSNQNTHDAAQITQQIGDSVDNPKILYY